MNRKKRELHPDLPPVSDPNYRKLYNLKHKERLKQLSKEWLEEKILNNPTYHKDQYAKHLIKQKEYRIKQRPYLMEYNWKSKGIVDFTYDKFLSELAAQNNKCKICGIELKLPHVDHDHKTGNYRGILCAACNTGLGIFEKNQEKFKNYLARG